MTIDLRISPNVESSTINMQIAGPYMIDREVKTWSYTKNYCD